jgi:hypothetical protein
MAQKEQFVKAVTGKLLMYAVGRQMDYDDAPAIRAMMRAAAGDDYRWSSTILAIVKSTPFQMRRAAARAREVPVKRSEGGRGRGLNLRVLRGSSSGVRGPAE